MCFRIAAASLALVVAIIICMHTLCCYASANAFAIHIKIKLQMKYTTSARHRAREGGEVCIASTGVTKLCCTMRLPSWWQTKKKRKKLNNKCVKKLFKEESCCFFSFLHQLPEFLKLQWFLLWHHHHLRTSFVAKRKMLQVLSAVCLIWIFSRWGWRWWSSSSSLYSSLVIIRKMHSSVRMEVCLWQMHKYICLRKSGLDNGWGREETSVVGV